MTGVEILSEIRVFYDNKSFLYAVRRAGHFCIWSIWNMVFADARVLAL